MVLINKKMGNELNGFARKRASFSRSDSFWTWGGGHTMIDFFHLTFSPKGNYRVYRSIQIPCWDHACANNGLHDVRKGLKSREVLLPITRFVLSGVVVAMAARTAGATWSNDENLFVLLLCSFADVSNLHCGFIWVSPKRRATWVEGFLSESFVWKVFHWWLTRNAERREPWWTLHPLNFQISKRHVRVQTDSCSRCF